MDDLDDREAFLRGIFADPASDLPRLVFADWLDERGEAAWAELIRLQCELARRLPMSPADRRKCLVRERQLVAEVPILRARGIIEPDRLDRGFVRPHVDPDLTLSANLSELLRRLDTPVIPVPADLLGDPAGFRRAAVLEHPEWYGCTELKVVRGLIVGGKPIQTILTSPVTERVTELDLSGATVAVRREAAPDEDSYGLLDEYEYRPAVTLQAVEALVDAREARRLTRLDLRNNDLDNDAARAVVRSTNLIRLKSLHLSDGNQFRGRTWQQLLERFGPDVLQ